MKLHSGCVYRRGVLCFMALYGKRARLWTMCSGQLLGIRDGDEVGVGFLPAQVEMRCGERWRWRLVKLRRSTWSSECRDGSEQLSPTPGGPGRYSDQIRGYPLHCKDNRQKLSAQKQLTAYLNKKINAGNVSMLPSHAVLNTVFSAV